MLKVHKIWLHDFWNENTSIDIFHFFVSVVEREFQQISFLPHHFFITLIQKLTQVLTFFFFFQILDDLTEKLRRGAVYEQQLPFNEKEKICFSFTSKSRIVKMARCVLSRICWKIKRVYSQQASCNVWWSISAYD